jgi:thioredoxin reductase
MYLKELASKVYIIHRTDKPVGSEETIGLLLQQQSSGKVSFIPNSVVKSISDDSKVNHILSSIPKPS